MNKKVYIIISLMTFTSFVNNFAHPVTPQLVSQIGYGPELLGTLFAAMSLSNFFMSPVWGRLSDKYGRKPFLIMAPIGYAFAQLGFGFSTNPNIIVFFRLLAGGIACASFVAGMAYLIDVSDPDKRTKIMAIYTASTGFSGTLGYLAGGLIGNTNYHYAFIAQATLCFVTAFFIFILIKEVRHKTKVKNSSNVIKDLLKYRGSLVPFLLLITMLTSFLALGFNNGFNAYMKFIMNLKPREIGFIMAITGFIGLFMNVAIFPLIRRKFNDFHSLTLSLFIIFFTLSLAVYFEKNYFNVSLIILVIFFAFMALYKPLLQSIISKVGNANGEIMGLNNAANALGMVGGSFYSGFLFSVSMGFTFYSFAFIGFISFGLLFLKRNEFEVIK